MEAENARCKKTAERRSNNPDDHIHQKAVVATSYAFRQPPGDDADDNPLKFMISSQLWVPKTRIDTKSS
jgi:hypothetical protein